MENLNELLGKLTEFLKSEVKIETIIGKEFQLGGFNCVPVMSVGIGLGTGGGEGKGNSAKAGEGQGIGEIGGAGIGMGPVGFLVTKDSEIQFVPATTSKGLSAIFEKVPGLIEKFYEKNQHQKAEAVN